MSSKDFSVAMSENGIEKIVPSYISNRPEFTEKELGLYEVVVYARIYGGSITLNKGTREEQLRFAKSLNSQFNMGECHFSFALEYKPLLAKAMEAGVYEEPVKPEPIVQVNQAVQDRFAAEREDAAAQRAARKAARGGNTGILGQLADEYPTASEERQMELDAAWYAAGGHLTEEAEKRLIKAGKLPVNRAG